MGTHVSFILEEPQSDEPKELVSLVQDLLSKVKEQSGKHVLFQWYLQRTRTDEAFASALLITEENERLMHALPPTNTVSRRR